MTNRITINLGDGSEVTRPVVGSSAREPKGVRRVDIAKKFRRVILLVVCLYVLSSFTTTLLVDGVMKYVVAGA